MTWRLDRNKELQERPAPRPLAPLLAKNTSDYIASDELMQAASVAIRLGVPLLLTGEPGTGKSSFADYLANHLNPSRTEALKVNAHSNMDTRDLYYSYDNVGRFRNSAEDNPSDFLKLNGLGEAILRGSDPKAYGGLREVLLREDHNNVGREVVLIDEIDKAPRDVPNDILSQLSGQNISFDATEIAAQFPEASKIRASKEQFPIIVCTSNSERSLPDAFLRRCVFFHIDHPNEADLWKIVDARIYGRLQNEDEPTQRVDTPFQQAQRLHFGIRNHPRPPQKKPGLAEFLDFLLVLKDQGISELLEFRTKVLPQGDTMVVDAPAWLSIAKVTLLKTVEDRERALELFDKLEEKRN